MMDSDLLRVKYWLTRTSDLFLLTCYQHVAVPADVVMATLLSALVLRRLI